MSPPNACSTTSPSPVLRAVVDDDDLEPHMRRSPEPGATERSITRSSLNAGMRTLTNVSAIWGDRRRRSLHAATRASPERTSARAIPSVIAAANRQSDSARMQKPSSSNRPRSIRAAVMIRRRKRRHRLHGRKPGKLRHRDETVAACTKRIDDDRAAPRQSGSGRRPNREAARRCGCTGLRTGRCRSAGRSRSVTRHC